MTKAFILINCELGSEKQIISDLKVIDCVKDVYEVFGAYDIVVNAESETVEKLRQLIIWKIRKVENIRSTMTLMGINGRR